MTNEQPNLQTSTALKIFVDFYGFPSWENNPKEGQNRNEIIKLWNETLKGYSEHQIEEAAFNIVRNQRTMKFPTISHMRAQLFDKSKDAEIQQHMAELKNDLLNREWKQILFASVPALFMFEAERSCPVFMKMRHAGF